ncbi:MAG: U32 family peptidase C-terminal domain-containing protein [Ignavibacteriales bacterium]|nr:U32 family peptidase C-terminal domain-containing protein [Ignavibacteriales bacterium]
MVSNPKEKAQWYEKNVQLQTHEFVGVIREMMPDGLARMEVRNRIEKGQEIEVFFPDFSMDFTQPIDLMKNRKDEVVEVAHGGAGTSLLNLKRSLPGCIDSKKV